MREGAPLLEGAPLGMRRRDDSGWGSSCYTSLTFTFKLPDLDYKLSDNILALLPGNIESIFLNDKPLVSLASEILSYKLTWRLHYILFPLFFGSFKETIWRLH
jgi:hypothetical protein